MTSLLGFPVEVWLEIFVHYLQPDFVFNADFAPFQIEAFHENLVKHDSNKPIWLSEKKKTCLKLVCREWKNIIDDYPSQWKVKRYTRGPDIADENYNYKGVLLKWPNTGSRLVVRGRDLIARNSYSEFISVLCFYTDETRTSRFAKFEHIDGLIRRPQDLEVLHLSCDSYRIPARLMTSMTGIFSNLRVLSIYAECIVLFDIPLTFPQVSTLILEMIRLDWMNRFPPVWQFPKLCHLSLEYRIENNTNNLFADLLERYGGQLHTLRHPFWSSLPSSNVPLTNLKVFATDVTQFALDESHTFSSVEHLVQVSHLGRDSITRSDDGFSFNRRWKYPRTGEQLPEDHTAYRTSRLSTIEGMIYRGMAKTIPFLPHLKAIHIPEDVASIVHGVVLRNTAASFATLREVCISRGIRILNLEGETFLPLQA